MNPLIADRNTDVSGLSPRLWSLWDMIETNAAKFWKVMTLMQTLNGLFNSAGAAKPDDVDKSIAVSNLEELAAELRNLQATSSARGADRLINEIRTYSFWTKADIAQGYRELSRRIHDDLEDINLYSIEKERMKFFSGMENVIGKDVTDKFIATKFEFDEAGKCLALGRPTSSVFHLMRVVEVGLEAVRLCLGIPDPIKEGDRNWGAVFRKLKGEFEARKNGTPKPWANADDARLFEEIHGSLDVVRNLWRNPTMHVEGKYVEDEAEHILLAVRALMRKIASRCDEEGKPFA